MEVLNFKQEAISFLFAQGSTTLANALAQSLVIGSNQPGTVPPIVGIYICQATIYVPTGNNSVQKVFHDYVANYDAMVAALATADYAIAVGTADYYQRTPQITEKVESYLILRGTQPKDTLVKQASSLPSISLGPNICFDFIKSATEINRLEFSGAIITFQKR